jgi:copper(I)-binding protein
MQRVITAAALGVAMASAATAQEYKLGDLHIDHPVLRVASPVSKTGAGFMTITNRGKAADRLLSVTTTAASRSDLHGTINQGGVMQMRAQAGGVPIPAGGKVAFAPGGLHVMFIGLKAAVPPGEVIKARLTFEKAGAVDVGFKAETAAAAAQHQH